MSLDPVRARLRQSGAVAALPKTARALPSGGALRVKGAAGSLPAFLLADVADLVSVGDAVRLFPLLLEPLQEFGAADAAGKAGAAAKKAQGAADRRRGPKKG